MSDSMKRELEKISLVLSKDQFDDFFRENYHAACLVAMKYIADINQAEDLVQDVFVILWEKRETLQIKTDLKNYFFKAVKNNALKKVQRDKGKIISLSTCLLDDLVEDDDHFDEEELAVKIFQAIGELPAACRTIFDLAYREKLTYRQIADQLNVSKNTVKTQMGIAYRQLRHKLESVICLL
jgi:RNA polymerase sigma-70 factor (ECF subfamily)